MIFAPTVSWSIAWLSIFFIKICFWLKYIYRYKHVWVRPKKKRISLFFWFLWHDSWQIKKSHKFVLEWLFVYFEQIGRKSNMKNPVWPKKSCGFYFILYSCCIPTHFIFRTLYSPFRAMDSCDSNSIIHFVKLWKICSIEKKGSSSAIHN